MDFDLDGDMEAIAVTGRAGCCFAALLSAAILSRSEDRAPPGLPAVEAEKPL